MAAQQQSNSQTPKDNYSLEKDFRFFDLCVIV